jgi:(p)ppGpp synthase/HD superfamily hydrolase
MSLNTIEGAIEFATRAHDGQVDMQGSPYILHPLRVGARLHEFGDTYVITGLLHDVVEDTPHTLDDLRALGAHPHVIEAVALLTRTDRHEPYVDHVTRLARHPIAAWVKTSDVIDNYQRIDGIADPATRARLTRKYESGLQILETTAGIDVTRLMP